ncbi:hypothetical protein N0V82_004104 [Gnomoniopsis sp. IMI 355080]|nr:hypothetical protein N0V82_004104 [Gnomoniopsis sp. IMI 355080]
MLDPFPFRALPLELRLRILEHTYLGPPETGDYDPRFQSFIIRDGRRIPGMYDFAMRESHTECTCSPAEHDNIASRSATCAIPRCRCRKLPLALFVVDRQMYHEAAVEVFYPNAYFNFYEDDLRAALAFLRDVVPRQALAHMRRIKFTMTVAQCEGWADGALASGYPAHFLENILHVSCEGSARPPLEYRADWRALLAFLGGAHADLARLTITVDISECSWEFLEDPLNFDMYDGNQSMYRFLYDLFIDVTTAMCSLHTIGDFKIQLGVFSQLKPWLEREVLGQRYSMISEVSGRMNWYDMVPKWHNVDQRLPGSNYSPEA